MTLRERVAKAIWDAERRENARIERKSVDYYAKWPADAIKQPYCQSTYRIADAVLAALDS